MVLSPYRSKHGSPNLLFTPKRLRFCTTAIFTGSPASVQCAAMLSVPAASVLWVPRRQFACSETLLDLQRAGQTFPPGIGSHSDRSIGTPMHGLNRSHGIGVHWLDSINGEMLA